MTVLNAIKKYFSSLLLVVLVYPLFKASFPTDCYFVSRCGLGDPSFLLMVLLLPILAFVLFVIIAVATYRLYRNYAINSAPFYTMGVLVIVFLLMKLLYPDVILGKKVLTAEKRNGNEDIKITLRGKKSLEMRMFHGTRGMVHLSSYRTDKDTLYIDGDINNDIKILESENDLLSDKYLIDSINQRMYPLHSYPLKDTAGYLIMQAI